MDDINHLLTIRRGIWTKEEFLNRINARDVPYISSIPNPEIERCEPYPFKEVVNKFSKPYFTNTICYMIAYALLKGVRDIELWGVAQMGANEYLSERAGVEFWIGLAAGMGVKISFMTPTLLLQNIQMNYPYGYVRTIDQLMDDE